MRSFRNCFWVGLWVRIGCAPLLLQWFHPDERQLLEFAHFQARGRLQPFLESGLHLRNQSAPWVMSWVIRWLDARGWGIPWAELTAFHILIGLWNWWGLWTLVRWFRRAHGPAGDRVALVLAWFFALFWAFPLLYSRGLLEALSFAPACFLWLAVERRRPWRSGWWAGCAAVLRYPSALWGAGALLLAAARQRISGKRLPAQRWERVIVGTVLGFAAAVVVGGLADHAIYGGHLLSSARAYWDFNRPHGPVERVFGNDSLAVYWHWFEYLFTPWLAPLFLLVAGYALWMTPRLLVFCAPYIIGHLLTPHREPRFMLPLTPFLILAIAVAFQRGRLGRDVWQRLRARRAPWAALKAVVYAHVALALAWYPLYAWGQWKSGQGELIRHETPLAQRAGAFALLSDPVAVLGVDALVPPELPWLDEHCRWHRPVPRGDLKRPLWALAREAPRGCVPAIEEHWPALPDALARVVRVKQARLYDCGSLTRAVEAICPGGTHPAAPGEPYFGKELPLGDASQAGL